MHRYYPVKPRSLYEIEDQNVSWFCFRKILSTDFGPVLIETASTVKLYGFLISKFKWKPLGSRTYPA